VKLHVQVIIFDFDGVIINSGADIANAVQHTLKMFDRPILPKDEIISYVGHGAESLIRRSFKNCSEELIKRALPLYQKHYFENAVVETELYPHVKEILQELKDRLDSKKIALVTNKPEDITLEILDLLGVRKFFDLIVGPESVSKMKPDPEGIIRVLSSLDITADRAIMVGDTYVDIEAGKSAGTFTCGVTYGLGDTDELINSEPDLLIDDISKLLVYIE
jgi:phosphoglycolate phosphatase